MKNTIKGIDYIPATKVMAWLAEAREIIDRIPSAGEDKLRIEWGFTREGYKVSYIPVTELLKRVERYPHTSFQKRPELMELVHRITIALDRSVAYEATKTVEVIRVSDGVHSMENPEVAEMLIGFGVAKYA